MTLLNSCQDEKINHFNYYRDREEKKDKYRRKGLLR